MSLLWRKVWFDLSHNPIRTLLAVLSIAVGVFAIGVVFSLADQMVAGVAMPFATEFENIYDFGMRIPIEQNNLLPVRTDKEFFIGSVLEEIKKRIRDSIFVIVDVTTMNPNVMFELGYAEGCDKPTVVVCRTDQKLPFDVAGMNVIFYNPLLIRELNQSLTTAIRQLMIRWVLVSSSISTSTAFHSTRLSTT